MAKINHIGIAVRSIDQALPFYKDALGLGVVGREEVSEQRVRVAKLRTGESAIELLEPLDQDSPIAAFLLKRGEGIHHIALEVENIHEALKELQEKGVRLVDQQPRIGADGHLIAFLHPSASHGVLIELTQKAKP
ncbi:MAG: methylmalonyl-CoA epimerase [Acidobacteria bacterium]|nr:methylmalonyl-CoA epimerase [Acidobacteriota bacterium]